MLELYQVVQVIIILLYKELSWPILASRRHTAKLKLMHKIIHKNVTDYLTDVLLSSTSDNITYNLRNKGNLNQYATRTEKFKRWLMPDCIRKWNSLWRVVRKIVSYKEFTKVISIKILFVRSIMVYLDKHQSFMLNLGWIVVILNCTYSVYMFQTDVV